MKIIQVAHGYPPYTLAGVEVYTRWFALTLSERHTVRVFSTRPLPDEPDLSLHEETLDGIPVTFLVNQFTDYDPIKEVRHERIVEIFADYLDRERPDVVHFQHLIKLSTTLLDICRDRGIATVLTLHDYWFLCPVITLLHRDLEICKTPGDVEACTRCEMATSYLNRVEVGTYYIAGMLESMMPPAHWRELKQIYDGDFSPVYAPEDKTGPALSTLRIGLIRRFMRDRLDVATELASPSRFLKEILEGNGLAPDGINHLPNGIDDTALTQAARPSPPPPLRVLYLGTINKHKGVHVLIDAANALADRPIEVSIYGTGPDEKYEAFIRDMVQNPAITFGGRYDRGDLPVLLGSHHVVVMPSVWYENYPIVIREAFAAGVPVVAPDLGAMPEAIRDGTDGLLYAPGDSGALAAVLKRLLDDPELLPRLAAGIEPVLGLADHIAAYEGLYETARRKGPRVAGSAARRILIVGPADSSTAFARVFSDALIATGAPRPTVVIASADLERGDLGAAIVDGRKRLDFETGITVIADPLQPEAPLDLAICIDGDEETAISLSNRGVEVLRGAPSLDEIRRALSTRG